LLLICSNLPLAALAQSANNVVTLSKSDINQDDNIIYISDTWLFKPGDNHRWSNPQYNDSTWQKTSTYLGPSDLSFIDWEGIGWFRFHFKVDSSLVGYPLALIAEQHHGASEIYLDGKKIYDIGKVSVFENENIPHRDNRPRPFVIDDTNQHVLAVRYANYHTSTYTDYGFSAGFRFLIGISTHPFRQLFNR